MIYGGCFLFGFHPEASILGARRDAAGSPRSCFFWLVVVPAFGNFVPVARLVPARDALLRGQLGLQHLARPQGQRRRSSTKLREGGGHDARAAREAAARPDGRRDGDDALARAPLHAPRGPAAARGAAARGRRHRRLRVDRRRGRRRHGARLELRRRPPERHAAARRAIQAQCGFEPGELRVVMVESQPLFGRTHALEDRRRGDRRARRGRDGDRADARAAAVADGTRTPTPCCAARTRASA